MQTRGPGDVEKREALILGASPRIAPLGPGEFGKEAMELVKEMRAAISLPPVEKIPDFNATMLRHPDLYRAHSDLALVLFKGALSRRDRQLAILRIGWLCQAPFEWGVHVRIGKATCGLTPEEIDWITVGSSARSWGEHDRAILRAVEELFEDAMISDETWEVLAKTHDDAQLLELPILVGQYQGVAYLQNSLRLRLPADNAGLRAR